MSNYRFDLLLYVEYQLTSWLDIHMCQYIRGFNVISRVFSLLNNQMLAVWVFAHHNILDLLLYVQYPITSWIDIRMWQYIGCFIYTLMNNQLQALCRYWSMAGSSPYCLMFNVQLLAGWIFVYSSRIKI